MRDEWTYEDLRAKAEWEGIDYIIREVNPDEVIDKRAADLIRQIREPYEDLAQYLFEVLP